MANDTKSQQTVATKKKDLIIDRVFNLPLSKLWKAWTEPETFKKWWGPKDFTCPYISIDFRVGGKYLACMRSSKGQEYWSTGVYKEIISQKKIVNTDSFSDNKGNIIPASDLNMPGEWPKECLVTITFEEAGGKSKLHLQHAGIPPEMHDECIQGWNQSLDKLQNNV